MRLLTVTPNYWPAFIHGGPVFSLYYLNKALVRKGIDVTVYTTHVDLDDRISVNREVDIDGVKVTYFSSDWKFSWPMTRALKANLKVFDLVYVCGAWDYSTVISASSCRRYKKPYVIAPRGMLYPDVFFKKAWKKWPYYQFILKRELKGAAAIHYTTEDEAEKTHSFFGLKNEKIIVPNGIDLSEFRNLPGRESFKARYPQLKDKKIILFLGRINWKKGLDILVQAYAGLIKERRDLHLIIAGCGEKEYGKKVKRWLKNYGISYIDYNLEEKTYGREAQATFTGMLTGEKKIEVYAGSDIFVLPSSYSENFGMSVAEAMACGLPVVISNKVGIYNEIKRHKAGMVIEANAESLYRAMKILLEKPDLRREIAINGKRLAEEYYDIDKVADKMIAAYREILV